MTLDGDDSASLIGVATRIRLPFARQEARRHESRPLLGPEGRARTRSARPPPRTHGSGAMPAPAEGPPSLGPRPGRPPPGPHASTITSGPARRVPNPTPLAPPQP